MPITVAYADADKALAQKLSQDLISADSHGQDVLVVLVSAASNADRDVQAQLVAASEARLHIVPVLLDDSKLPRLIDHLTPIDFRRGDALEALKQQIAGITAPGAPRPLVTHTPKLKRANLNSAIFIAIPVLLSFFLAIYLVGFMGVQMPQEEYDQVETARVQQRNTLIGPTLDYLLPSDAEGAANFQATIDAAPTRLQPFLIATATATIQGTHPVSPTPRATIAP
jgi:hypothetical protein